MGTGSGGGVAVTDEITGGVVGCGTGTSGGGT